jgi:cellulose synthase (UDP-forming)
MNTREKRIFYALRAVGLLITLSFTVWWFSPARIAHNFSGWWHVFDFALFALLSYVVWQGIISQVLTWFIAGHIRKPFEYKPKAGMKVAFITTFVPNTEPVSLLHNILPAMVQADYPHDTWLLDEGNNPEAKAVCKQYGVRYFSRKPIAKYNTEGGIFAVKTKGGNHNAWYDAHGLQYDIVAQIDTDFTPQRNFLTKTLGHFRNPSVAFVGTPQVYGNIDDSIVARGAAQQTYSFYGPILRGLHGLDMTLMIGANHVVRVVALKDIGLYQAHLTEDLLTGMSMHSKRWTSIYVPEILAVGEGPSTWASYFNQQMRWAFGCIDILFRHTLHFTRTMTRRHAWYYLLMQQHYFTGLAMALGVVLLTLYAWFGLMPASMGVWEVFVTYVPVILWQWFVSQWLQRFYADPKNESGMHWAGGLISTAAWPIYFMALVGVLRGKRLSFKVTPKGESQMTSYTPPSIFAPHIVIGTITGVDVVVANLTGNNATGMLFWTILSTVTMYGLIAIALLPQYARRLRRAVVGLLKRDVQSAGGFDETS